MTTETNGPGSVRVGDRLPAVEIPVTRTLIIASAIASRDFQDVHHDPVQARARGAEDIFMNILTTNGLVGRFVTDWAGADARLRRIAIRLGTQNYPGDVLRLTGEVAATALDPEGFDVRVRGENSRGTHVEGTVSVVLDPHRAAPSMRVEVAS